MQYWNERGESADKYENNIRSSGRIKAAPEQEDFQTKTEESSKPELPWAHDYQTEETQREPQTITTDFMADELLILQKKIAGLEQKLTRGGVSQANVGMNYIQVNANETYNQEDSRLDIRREMNIRWLI